MAKKQNGFGTVKSFATKAVKTINNKLDRSNAPKAAGVYPSNRRYGTSVQRTVIETYDAESDWIRWRKGYEYYVKAAFERLIQAAPVCGSPGAELADVCYDPGLPIQKDPTKPDYNPQYVLYKQDSTLYSDTEFYVDIQFTGWRFSTLNSDTANHYCIKRTLMDEINMFNVTEVLYPDNPDPTLASYAVEAKNNNELWVKGTRERDFPVLLRSIGERLTDGEVKNNDGEPVELNGVSTEGTLIFALNQKAQPAIYTGKSTYDQPNQVKVNVNFNDLKTFTDQNGFNFYEANNGDLNAYIGKIGYFPRFYTVEFYSSSQDRLKFIDGDYFFEVDLKDTLDPESGYQGFWVLDRNTALPPSLYDVHAAVPLYATNNFEGSIEGKFIFQKSDYQRFFGEQYLTAELVKEDINETSYPILPFIIKDATKNFGMVTFTAEPFISTLELFSQPPSGETGYLIFPAYGFTQTMLDTNTEGEYNHPIVGPYSNVYEQAKGEKEFSDLVWYKKINDVDPYNIPFVNIFSSPNTGLRPATVYGCSCPSYSSAQLRMPQTTQGPEERKINRQRNYPLPTALSPKDYENIGLSAAAGKIQSWQTKEQRASFNLCKHTIAAMFDDHLKIQEPNTYQTIDAREEFGAKLSKDIKGVPKEFYESYARGGITMLEVIFAIAQSINYDDIEVAYLVLNADDQFSSNQETEDTSAVAQRYNKLL